MELSLTRRVKQLAGHLGREPGSFCPAPIALESLVAKATASAYPAGSVSPGLGPTIRLLPYRPPWQTQARLRSRLRDSWGPVSKLLPLTAALLWHCNKQLVEEQYSPDRPPHFLCCPLARRSPPPAWTVPVPCPHDRHTPRYRMRAPVHRSHSLVDLRTTVVVPPSRRSPPRERQERREHYALRNHPVFAPAPRG